MRFLWLALALVAIGACALMRRPDTYPTCLELKSYCRSSAECCSDFCATYECEENPYRGGSKREPRGNEVSPHAE